MARLLPREDFELITMALVITNLIGVFRDAGLTQAAVLRSSICSFSCPEGTQFSHPSLRSGQTFGSPPTHFIRYPYGGAQKHLRTVVLRQVSQLSAPYYFYTFNFPTPATLVPPPFHFVHFFLNKVTIVCIFATFR